MKTKTLIELLLMNQQELVDHIKEVVDDSLEVVEVEGKYITINVTNKAKPMLCSHLDTVNTDSIRLSRDDIHVTENKLSLNPNSKARCLGGDDRCGVWIALRLIEDMLRLNIPTKYSFGFFFDEEVGGIGSNAYVDSTDFIKGQHTAFIGLDRKNSTEGTPEIASYDYDNDDLLDYFEEYKYEYGSFTDCSVLAGASDIACYNLSIGYCNEHTIREYITPSDMVFTYEYLKKLEMKAETYKATHYEGYFNNETGNSTVVCDLCGEHEKLYNVWAEDLGDYLQVCDCCQSFVNDDDFYRY